MLRNFRKFVGMKIFIKICLALVCLSSVYNVALAQNFQSNDITSPSKIENKVKAYSQPDELGFYQVQFLNTPTKVRFSNNGITSEIVMKYNFNFEYNLSEGTNKVMEITESIAKLFPKDRDIRILKDVATFGSCIGNSVVSPYEPIIISIYHDYSTITWKGYIWISVVY